VQLQFEQGIAPPAIEFGSPTGDFSSAPVELPPATAFGETPAPLNPPTPESPFPPLPGNSATLSPPSFAVMPEDEPGPEASVSPRAIDPTDSVESMSVPQVTATPIPEVAPVGHDAQAESVYRTVANNTSANNTGASSAAGQSDPTTNVAGGSRLGDPFQGIQSNPFYRPSEPGSPTSTVDPATVRNLGHEAFVRTWGEARELVEQGKFAPALAKLTVFYNSPDLSRGEQEQLLKTLDSLAGRVIYSTEHYLEQPYVVRNAETLMDIAAQYNVDWRLLQNINGIRDPLVLVPKTQLKVVRGPFHAEVNLTTSELTLFVDKYYAGRFPVSIGRDPVPAEKQYTVRDKRDGKDYYMPADGRILPARTPSNPFGAHWIDLGQEVSIHGSAQRDVSPNLGCISLSPLDAADVYGILSTGSTVTVRR
jgi:LysM repeat protein